MVLTLKQKVELVKAAKNAGADGVMRLMAEHNLDSKEVHDYGVSLVSNKGLKYKENGETMVSERLDGDAIVDGSGYKPESMNIKGGRRSRKGIRKSRKDKSRKSRAARSLKRR